MKVAVLTLVRDRLEYTRHCFTLLHDNAGCEYDHYVLDQGSDYHTRSWLQDTSRRYTALVELTQNIGISKGFNRLLDLCGDYDAVVTFDNDCEVTMPGTLATCAHIAAQGGWIVSPTVLGLNNPPRPGIEVDVYGYRVGTYHAIGGIFRAMPGKFASDFRFNEHNPLWGHDELDVGQAAAARGVGMGYLLDWHVNHYDTTSGQHAKYPDYFARTLAEGKPSL